jgi:spore coat protein U-like protein
VRRLIAAFAACASCAAVNAAQSTITFSVSASVSVACNVAANPVAFGTYVGTGASPTVDVTSSIVVTCPSGTNFDLRLDNGAHGSGAQRRMQITSGPVSFLNYELYQDAARTQRFGNNNAERVQGVGTGAPQSVPVYGSLPGAQIVPFGPYLDTIQATLNF